MAGPSRDWDKEMAAIDAVIAKGGYVAPSGGAPAPAPAGGGSAPAPSAPSAPSGVAPGGRAWMGMWARTLLGLGLAFGLQVWPWRHHCGLNLYFYLAAVGLLGVYSLWVMRISWVRRMGLPHLLALAMLGFATWLGAVEVLPRTGYAKVEKAWTCAAPATTPATNVPPTASPAPATTTTTAEPANGPSAPISP